MALALAGDVVTAVSDETHETTVTRRRGPGFAVVPRDELRALGERGGRTAHERTPERMRQVAALGGRAAQASPNGHRITAADRERARQALTPERRAEAGHLGQRALRARREAEHVRRCVETLHGLWSGAGRRQGE